jgi:hypothetical protein
MRFDWFVLSAAVTVATACGGHASAPEAPATPASPALRWVPDHPSYVISSPQLGDAQHSLRDIVELLGGVAGYDLADATSALTGLFGVDPLHAEPLAGIGVDLKASWAMFSDALDPTIVVRLAAPEQMAAFLEHQRSRGLVTHAVRVGQVEVQTAALMSGVSLSWAIDGNWMWVHVAHDRADDTAWLTASRASHQPGWAADWAWAERAAGAASAVVGLYDPRSLFARAATMAGQGLACVKLFEPVRRVALSIDADDRHFAARLAFDLGSTAGIQRMVLPPPAGFAAASARAAISGQWNLDLGAVTAWAAPCLALASQQPGEPFGVRTVRGFLIDVDPEQLAGSGAVVMDLASSAAFQQQLDRVPMRSALERKRSFGAYQGAVIDVPFGPTVEYVLDGKLLAAGLGEGLLAQVLTGPGGPGAPAIALDVAPPALSAKAWASLFQLIHSRDLSHAPGRKIEAFVERMLRWRDGHVALTTTPSELVLAVSGTRR